MPSSAFADSFRTPIYRNRGIGPDARSRGSRFYDAHGRKLPDDAPRVERIAGGGERFIFNFALKTCRACARDGTAAIGFEFDHTGKFAGIRLGGIKLANPAR